MSTQTARRDDASVWWDRSASASGIVFAALAFVGFLLTGRPEEQASAEEVVRFFADKQTETEWQSLLFGLAAIAFLWFASRLAQLIRTLAGPGAERFASLTVSGAAASAALFLAGSAAFAALAEGGERASVALFDFGDLAIGLATFTAAVFVAGATAGIMRSALMDHWVAWLGGLLEGLLVLNGIVRTLADGDAGATLGTISYVAFLAWVVLVSALLTLRHTRYAEEVAPG